MTCLEDHQFPDQTESKSMVCENGVWKVTDGNWDDMPDCQRT